MRIKREIFKRGRKIVAYIDTKQEGENTYYYVIFGKPSDSLVLTWRHKSYERAKEHIAQQYSLSELTSVVQ